MLSPKPEKPVPEQSLPTQKVRLEATPLSSIPAKGWYFETGVGAVLWGTDSQCSCNALAADVGLHHVNSKGFLIGGNLLLTNTISRTFSPTLKLGYHLIDKNKTLGSWSATIFSGPSISNIDPSQFIGSDEYKGFIYGGEVGFQPRLGRYSQLRGFMALGWLTSRETFKQDGWRGPTETKMTHSGIRIRFGLIL